MRGMDKILKQVCGSFCLALGMVFAACSETDYLSYDTQLNGLYYTEDTVSYSFGVTPLEVETYEYHIPVKVMGAVSNEERYFNVSLSGEECNAQEGQQYRDLKGVIPADSVTGYVSVVLLRKGMEGDYVNGFKRYQLKINLVEGNGFTPVLNASNQTVIFKFDNAIEQPSWLDYKGDKVWSVDEFGVWHPLKLVKMVEYFHAIEDVLPETYKKMVALYGENLETVQYGSFATYRTIMNKYVFYPMYEYFSNPDNREEILSLYADFPFDFPNPFEQ